MFSFALEPAKMTVSITTEPEMSLQRFTHTLPESLCFPFAIFQRSASLLYITLIAASLQNPLTFCFVSSGKRSLQF